MAMPLALKRILRHKKNYGKLKYFTIKKYNLPKILEKEPKFLQAIINSISNLKFQHKPKHHLSKILI
jgi:hypothetical protein